MNITKLFRNPYVMILLIIVVLVSIMLYLKPSTKEGVENRTIEYDDLTDAQRDALLAQVRTQDQINSQKSAGFYKIREEEPVNSEIDFKVPEEAQVFLHPEASDSERRQVQPTNVEGDVVLNQDVREKERICDNLNNGDLMTGLQAMLGVDCGYCTTTNKFLYGDGSGPITDVCPGDRSWVKTESQYKALVKKFEQDLCRKQEHCEDLVGPAAICGWAPLEGKAYVKEVNPKNPDLIMPKYDDDRRAMANADKDAMKYGLINAERCGEFASLNPCVGKNMRTGPHNMECLQKLWKKSGCAQEGTFNPANKKNSWWNTVGTDAVESDMKKYKEYNDSLDYKIAKEYMPRCTGKEPEPCDDKWTNKPMECYQTAFKESGGLDKGRLYPDNSKFPNYPEDKEGLKAKLINGTMSTKAFKDIVKREQTTLLDEEKHFSERNSAFVNLFGSKLPKPETKIITKNVGSQPGLNLYVYECRNSSGVKGKLLVPEPQRVSVVKFDTGFLSQKKIKTPRSERIYLVFEGHITYPEGSRDVQFRTTSNDGSRLYINNNKEVENWGIHSKRGANGNRRKITNTKEDLRLEFYEWRGAANIELMWAIDGGRFEIIGPQYLSAPIPGSQKARVTDWQCVTGIKVPLRMNGRGDIECASTNNKDCFWKGCDTEQIEKAIVHQGTALACGTEHAEKHGGPGYGSPNHWCEKGLKEIQKRLTTRGDYGVWLCLVYNKGQTAYSITKSRFSDAKRGLVSEIKDGSRNPPAGSGSFMYNNKMNVFLRADKLYLDDAFRRHQAKCMCGWYLHRGKTKAAYLSRAGTSSGCGRGKHSFNHCTWTGRDKLNAAHFVFIGHKNDIANYLSERVSLASTWFLDVSDAFKRHVGTSKAVQVHSFIKEYSYD